MRKNNKFLTCSACNGEGGKMEADIVSAKYETCYYCAGTRYQDDDNDSFERFYRNN